MRKPPKIEPPAQLEKLTHEQLGLIVQTRAYQVITPIFGGGVVPGEVDALTPVRGSEIRGQLRFWWRATRGGLFNSDLQAMKQREDEIWGKASFKAKSGDENKDTTTRSIQLEVVVTHSGTSKRPFNIRKNKNGENDPYPVGVPAYAAFPLLPLNDDLRQKTKEQIEEEMQCVQHDVQFLLKINYPQAYHADIQAALWAWETFGGIGARTRRGFGALRLLHVDGEKNTNLPANAQSVVVKAWLNRNLQMHVVSGIWPMDIPHLEQTLSFEAVSRASQVPDSWDGLVSQYAAFRQFRVKGKTGRSLWPEAEAIREITGRNHYKNKSLHHPRKFPRAAFGLPIIFHFKDETAWDHPDPHDTILQGMQAGNERLASPLILRPLVCRDNNAIGLAALLKGSVLPPITLKSVEEAHSFPKEGESVQAQLIHNDLTRTGLSDLNARKLYGETDVLQAFLNSLGGKR